LVSGNKRNTRQNIKTTLLFVCFVSFFVRWRVQIMILCSQLILANVQNAVFFIAFQRAFASIRRKMMLNILMQVDHQPNELNI
jgi:hypothetical protein